MLTKKTPKMAVFPLIPALKEDLKFLNNQPAQSEFFLLDIEMLLRISLKSPLNWSSEASQQLFLNPSAIASDFCKLACNFLSKGTNVKLYQAASQKLQIDVKQIQSGVEGLAYLFTEAAKNELSEEDFKLTVADLGFSEESTAIIYNEYLSQKSVLESILPLSGVQHLQYKDLQWRFETQVSSKALKNQNQTRVVLMLELERCGNVQNHCLQADIPNIIHMNQILNQALQMSRTQHLKRIQRAVT